MSTKSCHCYCAQAALGFRSSEYLAFLEECYERLKLSQGIKLSDVICSVFFFAIVQLNELRRVSSVMLKTNSSHGGRAAVSQRGIYKHYLWAQTGQASKTQNQLHI